MELVEATAGHGNGVHISDILAVTYSGRNLGVIETSLS